MEGWPCCSVHFGRSLAWAMPQGSARSHLRFWLEEWAGDFPHCSSTPFPGPSNPSHTHLTCTGTGNMGWCQRVRLQGCWRGNQQAWKVSSGMSVWKLDSWEREGCCEEEVAPWAGQPVSPDLSLDTVSCLQANRGTCIVLWGPLAGCCWHRLFQTTYLDRLMEPCTSITQ